MKDACVKIFFPLRTKKKMLKLRKNIQISFIKSTTVVFDQTLNI